MTCRSLTCRLVLMLLLSSIVLTAGAQANYQRDYRERVTTQKLPLPLDARSLDKRPDVAAALEFLYAYMVLPDLTDHSRAFYAREVSTTLRARREMPWGGQVPEREWLHFVLPLRVNNERIDSFRSARYEELKARVAGLTMAEAVLAVNHWCHEYVTYKPSDARTSSPLASMRTATGRCGEESTFTVAALRAVGIPARQVYTPRWAHTDDNHAWVEAWVDGKWHFLGACEPEPVLDLGWFNAPASRGMLMHTKAFGRYAGAEDRMKSTHCYTEINVTENYAETARTTALVVDEAGRPVPDADIWFKLYNYAEFYTVYRGLTDAAGRASITSGLGDLVAWASKGGRYGFQKFAIGRATACRPTSTSFLPKGATICPMFRPKPPRKTKSAKHMKTVSATPMWPLFRTRWQRPLSAERKVTTMPPSAHWLRRAAAIRLPSSASCAISNIVMWWRCSKV